jgi:hypothetical protein
MISLEGVMRNLLCIYLGLIIVVALFGGVWRGGLVRGLIASTLLPILFFVPGTSGERARAWLRSDDPP